MSIPPLNQKGFTLVEIMIVVAIIALLAAIAVPGFMRARKRSQASRILNDLRIIDSAVDQYAIENNKKTNDPVSVADWTSYVKKGSPLYNTGNSIFGTSYGSQTVDQLPQVSTRGWDRLLVTLRTLRKSGFVPRDWFYEETNARKPDGEEISPGKGLCCARCLPTCDAEASSLQ